MQRAIELSLLEVQSASTAADDDLSRAMALSLYEQEVASAALVASLNAALLEVDEAEQQRQQELVAEDELFSEVADIRELFEQFDAMFFARRLGCIEVRWSSRMTLCAGLFRCVPKTGVCSISLSEPLLKFRSREDMVDTLLHEMIHAYLFLTQKVTDRDGHGEEFQKHMRRINESAGTHITIYHTFKDEVDFYRQHIWRCDGPCREKSPYYGWVKRSMNRPPQKAVRPLRTLPACLS